MGGRPFKIHCHTKKKVHPSEKSTHPTIFSLYKTRRTVYNESNVNTSYKEKHL